MVASPQSQNRSISDKTGRSSAKAVSDLLSSDRAAEQFLTDLLDTQCRLAKAETGAILRPGEGGRPDILAAYPLPGNNGNGLAWVVKVEKHFRKVMRSGETSVVRQPADSEDASGIQRYLLVVPLEHQGIVRAAAAFQVRTPNPHKLLVSHTRLETTSLLLNYHEMQLTVQRQLQTTEQLRRVMEVLDAVNRPTRFLEAAMVLCNEMAARFHCSRVSLGLLKGRSVHVRAMSHTDTFNRQTQVVQAIEAAMEECLDQDLEVIYPAGDQHIVAIRAAASLAENHGPLAVLSLPIRQAGEVTAVLTLERPVDKVFNQAEEIETIRLMGDLCAPRLLDLQHSDRWFGARLAEDLRPMVGRLLGHEHTWPKLIALLICCLVVSLATINGDYRINAPFTLRAQHQQAVVAPFDTFSKSVNVEPGDRVEAGKTLLGTLESAELRLKLAALKAERLGYQKQMTASMRDRRTSEAQIAGTQIDKVAAQIRMIEQQIEKADLVAPVSGWMVSEDRKQKIGAPVKAGEILFEIASIDSLRAEIYIPESSIASIVEGQSGTLAVVGHPEHKIDFTIRRIHPIAEVVDHQNVFRVRATMAQRVDWMRPGMAGEARIAAGRRTYLWMATHRVVDWLRMKLWI